VKKSIRAAVAVAQVLQELQEFLVIPVTVVQVLVFR